MLTNRKETSSVPEGLRDLVPPHAARKRDVETAFLAVFQRWGYQEIVTPALEYYETVAGAGGEGWRGRVYRLVDPEGHVLALRPDMTAPIARVAGTRLRDLPRPLRLCYLGSVYRHDRPRSGRPRELFQAGIELIGADSPASDAEVIAIAVDCLRAVGLSGFKVGVGHAAFMADLVGGLAMPAPTRALLREALVRKDFVVLEDILTSCDLSEEERDVLRQVATLQPGRPALASVLERVRQPTAAAALRHLDRVFAGLEACGMAGDVYLDFGVIRDFDYYTGVVFEVYVPGLGYPVAGGGRYDGLLARYGAPDPATGFALGIYEVLSVLERDGEGAAGTPGGCLDYLLVPEPGNEERALVMARELRQQGNKVGVDLISREEKAATVYARACGARRMLVVGRSGYREVSL